MRLYDVLRLRISAKRVALWGSVALLLGGAQVAHAVSWDKNTDFRWDARTGKIEVFPGAGTGSVWAANQVTTTANGPQVSRSKALPFNPSPTATFKAVFTPANIAKAVTRPGVTLVLGAALSELVNQACVRLAGGVMTNNGTGWEECNMVSQNQVQYAAVRPYGGMAPWGTRQSSCQAAADHSLSVQSPAYIASHTARATILANNTCQIELVRNTGQIDGSWNVGFQTQTVSVQVQDGWKPATDSVAETSISNKLTTMTQADFSYGTSKVRDALNELMTQGAAVEVPTISVDPIPNIVGQPVTTTTTINNPDGSTTTQTKTTTKTSSFPVSGNNTARPSISQTDSSSSTTTQNGQTTSTETTSDTPQQPKDDFCTQNPDSITCQQMDTPALEVPKRTETLTYVAEAIGLGNGACPAPIQWTDSLGTHSINLANLCNILSTIVKPLIIAFAFLSAAFIVMPGKAEA